MEYMGVKGNAYFILDYRSFIAFAFNSFGEMFAEMDLRTAEIQLCNSEKTPVTMISVLGESTKPYCEMYFGGYVTEVGQSYTDVIATLNSTIHKANHMIFRIPRGQGVSQILLPTNQGVVSRDDISSVFPNLDWVRVPL